MKGCAVMNMSDGPRSEEERPLRLTVRFESRQPASEVERALQGAQTGLASPILDIGFRHDNGEPATLRVEVLGRPVEATSAGDIYVCRRTPTTDEDNEVTILIPPDGAGYALITIAH